MRDVIKTMTIEGFTLSDSMDSNFGRSFGVDESEIMETLRPAIHDAQNKYISQDMVLIVDMFEGNALVVAMFLYGLNMYRGLWSE